MNLPTRNIHAPLQAKSAQQAHESSAQSLQNNGNNKDIELDTLGRTVRDAQYRYTYTIANQVHEVFDAKSGARIASYRYNAAGQRVSKTVFAPSPASAGEGGVGGATYYLWHQGKLVGEIEAEKAQASQSAASTSTSTYSLTTQYLYLSEGGKSLPIAKLESGEAIGNTTGVARTLYIHSDHRGAPLAMTDGKQNVVWKADTLSQPWGQAKLVKVTHTSVNAAPAQSQSATLNLRLPGQYFDAETNLHDNWHRTYNPQTGRYLQPDPLGYPDGEDTYLYVNGDPVNKVDPLGLYEIDVHYYMTYFLARMAGIDEQAALTIALAAQYVDNNPVTRPVDGTNWLTTIGSIFVNQPKLMAYHFVLSNEDGKTDPSSNNSDISNPISFQLDNLLSASQKAPTKCARFQFLGEYLHAFEDTFSHRDRNNRPYDALSFGNLGIGHGLDGHEPDFTYNDSSNGWTNRQERTLQMELEVFRMLQGYGDPGKSMTAQGWDEISLIAVLAEFNSDPKKETQAAQKAQVLSAALRSLGLGEIPPYNCAKAAENRDDNLRGVDGKRLNQADYPGTILDPEVKGASGC